ncbi:MAG: serine hydrolase [Mucilaginibacter sp.]|nr:serine hydrolase [Mucilaginibacter sp.]
MQSRLSCSWLLAITLLIFTKSSPVFAQSLTTSQIDSLANKDLKLFHVPGMAIGIIKDGKLIYSKGFGVSSLLTKKAVDSETLFGIASNTKAFTAAALGLLVDEKKINWDDKVIKYIPEFRLYDPLATREMTIRDLLCHRSGLATGVGDLMHDPDSTDFTVNEIIYNLRYLKPKYSFRSKFAYDNNLYLVAGEVIARVSKMRWEDFVEQRILKPLGMENSAASYYGCNKNPNIIDPHNLINDAVKVVVRYTSTKDDAAGGVYSNVVDMSKWLLMLMNNGKYGEHLDKQLLSEQTVKELLSPQMLISVGKSGAYNTHFAAYGLGWFLLDAKGYKQVIHTGEDVGMVSEVSMIPELKLGIIVLTNSVSNAIDAITYQITDSYLNVKDLDRSSESFARLNSSERSAKHIKDSISNEVSQRQLKFHPDAKQFVGTYHDQWFGNVTISIRNDQLWFAAQRSPQLRGFLLPYKNNTFFIRWQNPEVDADTFVLFTKAGTGQINGITLQAAVPNMGYNFDNLFFQKVAHK